MLLMQYALSLCWPETGPVTLPSLKLNSTHTSAFSVIHYSDYSDVIVAVVLNNREASIFVVLNNQLYYSSYSSPPYFKPLYSLKGIHHPWLIVVANIFHSCWTLIIAL